MQALKINLGKFLVGANCVRPLSDEKKTKLRSPVGQLKEIRGFQLPNPDRGITVIIFGMNDD
jgi:hypothetical protein